MWLHSESTSDKFQLRSSPRIVIISDKMSHHRRNSLRKNCCSDVLNHLLRLRFSPEELEQRDKSRKIDKFLEKDKNSFRRQVMSTTFPFFISHPSLSMNHFSMLFHIFIIVVATERSKARGASIVYCLHILQDSALYVSCFAIFVFLGEIASPWSWRVGKVDILKANENYSRD